VATGKTTKQKGFKVGDKVVLSPHLKNTECGKGICKNSRCKDKLGFSFGCNEEIVKALHEQEVLTITKIGLWSGTERIRAKGISFPISFSFSENELIPFEETQPDGFNIGDVVKINPKIKHFFFNGTPDIIKAQKTGEPITITGKEKVIYKNREATLYKTECDLFKWERHFLAEELIIEVPAQQGGGGQGQGESEQEKQEGDGDGQGQGESEQEKQEGDGDGESEQDSDGAPEQRTQAPVFSFDIPEKDAEREEKKPPVIDDNLRIPRNRPDAYTRGACEEAEQIQEITNYCTDYLSGLHGCEILKQAKKKKMGYDGSGQLLPEQTAEWYTQKGALDLVQTKKTEYLKDKPDVILIVDTSGSVCISQIANHVRVLSGAIGSVFVADINKIYLINFDSDANFYEFNDVQELHDKLINGFTFGGGFTCYSEAFEELHKHNILNSGGPRLIVMITDGAPNELVWDVSQGAERRVSMATAKQKKFKTEIVGNKLLEAVDSITGLSTLDNTVFRMVVIGNQQTPQSMKENLIGNVKNELKRARTSGGRIQELTEKYARDFFTNSIFIPIKWFETEKAFNAIVEDIRREMHKFENLK